MKVTPVNKPHFILHNGRWVYTYPYDRREPILWTMQQVQRAGLWCCVRNAKLLNAAAKGKHEN